MPSWPFSWLFTIGPHPNHSLGLLPFRPRRKEAQALPGQLMLQLRQDRKRLEKVPAYNSRVLRRKRQWVMYSELHPLRSPAGHGAVSSGWGPCAKWWPLNVDSILEGDCAPETPEFGPCTTGLTQGKTHANLSFKMPQLWRREGGTLMVAMGTKGFISVDPAHLSLSFPVCPASARHMCIRATHKGGNTVPTAARGLYYWGPFMLEKLFLLAFVSS